MGAARDGCSRYPVACRPVRLGHGVVTRRQPHKAELATRVGDDRHRVDISITVDITHQLDRHTLQARFSGVPHTVGVKIMEFFAPDISVADVPEDDFITLIRIAGIGNDRFLLHGLRRTVDDQGRLFPVEQQRLQDQIVAGLAVLMVFGSPENIAAGAATTSRPGEQVGPAGGSADGAVRHHKLIDADFRFIRIPFPVAVHIVELAHIDVDIPIEAEFDVTE